MAHPVQPLLTDTFLASRLAKEYLSFRGSATEASLLERLKGWAARKAQKETTAEGAFVGVFFKKTWGYRAAGEGAKKDGYTCEPQYAVRGAGEGGGTGAADLALGYFDMAALAPTPQVLCEFKDVRSGLDKPQRRKGNDRSPVRQCADYLKEAASSLYGNEPIQPMWGVVSDMNEFRLYWRKTMPNQYQRFVLVPGAGDEAVGLLEEGDDAAFQRFVFWHIFQSDSLLTHGGPAPLERLITEQWIQEQEIENDFYKEYQTFRQKVFATLVASNPSFSGSRGKLVRLTQRLLDRCIFILFCEDMGAALNFPRNILRDVLAGVSTDADYDSDDDAAWSKVKKLFASMRDGSPFRHHAINRFNGGLFAEEPALESLHVPTRLFCASGQGLNAESLTRSKDTLLFFSANYNFGVSGGSLDRTIGLNTLGRIFEQSITELEYMEAKADGRASITELTKRKRDGVYYTPEKITHYIVEETVGAFLAEHRQRLELDPLPSFAEDDLVRYRKARASSGKKDKRFNTESVDRYVASLDALGAELDQIRVLDPACGSGAFLIQVLDRLVAERRWLAAERERITGQSTLFDADAVTRAVLSKNIYGVDINEESIELTRLALWLHTALPDRPLTSLDHNIRCGNSLLDSAFYRHIQKDMFSADERERINVFDWRKAFPEVMDDVRGRGGFDCIVGNPPYVKLQHFQQVLPAVASYLTSARAKNDAPLFESTQTQNFDLYLPFIERSIGLLNKNGRMGFIAPNLWLISEYGEGLRQFLRREQRLERWLDFRDYPVFDEAMTYTAIQFFRGSKQLEVTCNFAPTGELGAVEWDRPDAVKRYDDLPPKGTWILLPEQERVLLQRLTDSCSRLDQVADGIIVGVQTSADHVYMLEKIAPGRYREFPKKKPPVEVQLEDELMRPLVSGEEAKRYQTPKTSMYLLFPYADALPGAPLYEAKYIKERCPLTWRYLQAHERELRDRESGKMDRDDRWWGYNYPKNIEKQKLAKLGVAQTVPEMRVFYDEHGSFCFNNVRVNGILLRDSQTALFIMGLLNSRVSDFVIKRISKPKEPRPSGAYFEANKQYLAPLPIPKVTGTQRERVIGLARKLQGLHTERRNVVDSIASRLASPQMVDAPRTPSWFWAELGGSSAPAGKRRASAAGQQTKDQDRLRERLDAISRNMPYGATMCAVERAGEMRFYVGQRCVISGVYVSEEEVPLVLAQWRQVARDAFASDTMNADKLVAQLLALKTTDNHALVEQLRKLNREIDTIENEIRAAERELDDLAYELYALTPTERVMVELDTRRRCDARLPRPPAEA